MKEETKTAKSVIQEMKSVEKKDLWRFKGTHKIGTADWGG